MLSNKSARLSLGLKDSEALMISFPIRTGSLSDNDRYQLKILGELLEHDPTETILTQPNDPRMKAYIETAVLSEHYRGTCLLTFHNPCPCVVKQPEPKTILAIIAYDTARLRRTYAATSLLARA